MTLIQTSIRSIRRQALQSFAEQRSNYADTRRLTAFLEASVPTSVAAHVASLIDGPQASHTASRTASHTASRTASRTAQLRQMEETVKQIPSTADLLGVSRALSHTLSLANCAESASDTHMPSIAHLGKSRAEVLDALREQRVEIVLTAHPTELQKPSERSVLSALTHAARESNRTAGGSDGELSAQIGDLWRVDELRRVKPSPFIEASEGTDVVESVLWEAVPRFMRELDASHGLPLPPDCLPVRFASWMGGDRDGNPNVTADVTRTVCAQQRVRAARLLQAELHALQRQFAEVRSTTDTYTRHVLSKVHIAKVHGVNANASPYERHLQHLGYRLKLSETWAAKALADTTWAAKAGPPPLAADELQSELLVAHASLCASGNTELANGELLDTIRRVACFGLTLLPIDVRQEASRHTEAVAAITAKAGIGDYAAWDEEHRVAWLSQAIDCQAAQLQLRAAFDCVGQGYSDAAEVIDTFRTVSEFSDSIGAYVISHASAASDVLSVLLLQQLAGVKQPRRVVPLFETLADLQRAPSVVSRLLQVGGYASAIGGRQEIMLGYSDSAKDAGRLASAWALHEAQEAILGVGNKNGVQITFFHGKGGTIGRGGNPDVCASIVSAHPPGVVDGRYRVTEQGEMATRRFGDVETAVRSLCSYTDGVLRSTLRDRSAQSKAPDPAWRRKMAELAETSCAAYRSVLCDDERFAPYFHTATPLNELGRLNIGSRPSNRSAVEGERRCGVETLRCIPWIFAWSQTRLNLPAWLGVDAALREQSASDMVLLREMYAQWPWFRTTLGLVESALDQSDGQIAEHYDARLLGADDAEAAALGEELRTRLRHAAALTRYVTQHQQPPAKPTDEHTSQSDLRSKCMDALHVVQVESISRLRGSDGACEDGALRDAALVSIKGIAAGLRRSG